MATSVGVTTFELIGTFAAANFDTFVEVADVLRYFEGPYALGCCQDSEESNKDFHDGSRWKPDKEGCRSNLSTAMSLSKAVKVDEREGNLREGITASFIHAIMFDSCWSQLSMLKWGR